jgi:hypothetical protein
MNCSQTAALGGYLLGALEPDERSIFESHLSGCDLCRSELVRLAPLPGLLHQITLEDFESLPDEGPVPEPIVEPAAAPQPLATVEEPVVVEASVLEAKPTPPEVPARRRRYWLVAAAAALVLVLTVGGVLGYRALQDESGPVADGVTWSATDPGTGVRGDVRLVEHGWGTEVQIKLSDSPPGKTCRLVVWDEYGKKEVAGWWSSNHEPYEEIPGSTSFNVDHIRKFEVMIEGDNQMLVAIPAPNGAQNPPS